MFDVAGRLEHLIPANRIADFARRWRIRKLALFGSVLRDDFDSESDVDVLVSFDPAATWSIEDSKRPPRTRLFITSRGKQRSFGFERFFNLHASIDSANPLHPKGAARLL